MLPPAASPAPAGPAGHGTAPPAGAPPQPLAAGRPEGGTAAARRALARETWFVQLAFLLPGVVSAVDELAVHLAGAGPISFFPTVIRGHPVENLILSGASYLAVGALVPLALLLLARTGDGPAALGLADRHWRADLLPGAGLAAASCVIMFALSMLLRPLSADTGSLVAQLSLGPVPAYYLVYGLLVAAVTAVTEETLVNGYLLTRLRQLGWRPQRALLLSLALRTSYHLYYGLGVVLTLPFGYFVTRSFAKRGRLGRPVFAHFLYDAVLISLGMLIAARR
jgi:membrane protease YdiL (CAAX protease family)